MKAPVSTAMAEPPSPPTPATAKPAPTNRSLQLRSILVPTDFSPLAQQAIQFAASLATALGARITLVTVVVPLAYPDTDYFPLVMPEEQTASQVKSHLERVPVEESLDPALFTAPVVRVGVAFDEIIAAAREMKADLIAMATHGFTGVQRFWLGSTAERVVRHADCPVLVIRGTAEAAPPKCEGSESAPGAVKPFHLSRLLVPSDFSDSSRRALRYAERLAEAFGATLRLAYVIESISRLRKSVVSLPESTDDARAALRSKLASLANEELDELVPVQCDVLAGRPAREIVEAARSGSADIIVMSTHGRTGLKHVLLGSVAEEVVRQAGCPVLVVRESERDFV